MNNPLNIKQQIKDWFSDLWERKVKEPIARKTEELEGQVGQQIDKYSSKTLETVRQPLDYYRKQEAFYRGVFWICVALLIILWIVSGS